MTSKEAKAIALEAMMMSVGTAYYRISDGDEYSEEDKQLIIDHMNKYGERIAKTLKTDYIDY